MPMSLQVSSLSYCRGFRTLFADLSFVLEAGQSLWVSGRNGCGKSSLLRLLCGLGRAQEGEIRWRHHTLIEDRERFQSELLYIGHHYGNKAELSAAENLRAYVAILGWSKTETDIQHALAEVGLQDVAQLPARFLSQGQQKRIALARLFLPNLPVLLILDEPFSALDQAMITKLTEHLNRHLHSGGIVIYTSHQDVGLVASSVLNLEHASSAPSSTSLA